MTIRPDRSVKKAKDEVGAALLKKMKALAKTESKGKHIVQIRVTPKGKPPHGNCSCACSG
jgi:hypothetical protein